jgi:hypothetical protein
MNRFSLFLINMTLMLNIAWAQSATDAFRYSAIQYGGTARTLGTGNSMSVLGGDFASIGINPAGLATFRRSDLSLSLGYFMSNANAQLRGDNNQAFDQSKNKVSFDNVGLVLSNETINPKWRTSNFAIGLNKLANFNREFYYSGNSPGSLATFFKNRANEEGVNDDFGSGLAYDSYAIDYDSTAKRYFSDFDGNPFVPVNRTQTATTTGYANEMVISYAGNYNDKLSLGITLGIPFTKYTFTSRYAEEDKDNSVKFFNNLIYNNNIITEGAGVNLKIGAIYRVNQMLRIGGAIHTPSSLSMKETYDADMFYSFTSNSGVQRDNNAESPIGEVEYKVITPWKFIGSAGVLVGKYGFITAEAEFINYASSKVRFDTPDSIGSTRINELKGFQANLDKEIKAQYQSALNVRIGGELAYEAFRLRAGWNYLGAAQQVDGNPRNIFSVGAGVRGNNMYFDIAYRTENQKFTYNRYDAGEEARIPKVNVKNRQNAVVATIGFKF